MKLSRRSDLAPFRVMDIFNRAHALETEGRRIIHMEAGQPATPAPEAVLTAARRALDESGMGYMPLGLPQLRARIAAFYGERYDLDIDPARIVITSGSSAGFVLVFLGLFDPGARVGLGAPYYPAYPNILKALGCMPVLLPTDESSHYQVTADVVRAHLAARPDERLDGLLIASPANPTGAMLTKEELRALVACCAEEGISLISDEIYHGITYGGRAHSALEFSDDLVVVNSFSKYFSMTGWRIGWLVVPDGAVRAIQRLDQNLYIATHAISQFAALAAFEAVDELDAYVAAYARNRELLLAELPKAGFARIAPADGAFYLYADISHITQDSEAFCYAMLEDIGIAATPGTDFDRGERAATVRFSYAGSFDAMTEAMERLKAWDWRRVLEKAR